MLDLSSINIRTLLFFIAVYDAQSFSRVARKEGVSASMISRTMQQFEEAVGQQLFYRNTRSVIPTEAAHQLIEYVRAIADELARAKEVLQNRAATCPERCASTPRSSLGNAISPHGSAA